MTMITTGMSNAAGCRAAEVSDHYLQRPGQAPLALHVYRQRRSRHGATIVVHFHGGAFTCGSGAQPSLLTAALHAAGALVVSVDYPLAPAHPFPQAVDAGYATLLWAHQQRVALSGCRSALLVAGEEAGANLAAAVALMARDRLQPKLSGTVLLSPMLDPCVGTASQRHSKAGPVGCKWADGWTQYLQNPADAEHPYAVPAMATRQSGLPPTLLLTADDDPMRDEALTYGARLRSCGVTVEEALLPPPTGLPDALSRTDGDKGGWRDTLQQRLDAFLTRIRAIPPSCHPT